MYLIYLQIHFPKLFTYLTYFNEIFGSENTLSFSGERLITQLEITQSTEDDSTERSSISPLRTLKLLTPAALIFSFALSTISYHVMLLKEPSL